MNVDKQKLIEARVESGFDIAEIVEKADISRATLWRIESGKSKPTGKTLSKLCELYNKQASYFFKGGSVHGNI